MLAWGISENKMAAYCNDATLRLGRFQSSESLRAKAWIKNYTETVRAMPPQSLNTTQHFHRVRERDPFSAPWFCRWKLLASK